MADTRPSWKPSDLFSKAESIANLLVATNDHIVGVALAGSLARMEKAVHDIDLVVLHDGQEFSLGRLKYPQLDTRGAGKFLMLKHHLTPDSVEAKLDKIRGPVPVDFTLVSASVLWSCAYLQTLGPFEVFTDFYRRTFNDDACPLYLIGPHRFGANDLKKFYNAPILLGRTEKQVYALGIRHKCVNKLCRPVFPWKVCKEEARARKESKAYINQGY